MPNGVIYVNDNPGRWRSDFDEVAASRLKPRRADYFVLKPAQSGFHHDAARTLLNHLEVPHLALTGLTADRCVLTTAMDAHIRDYPM
jgi:nicotinamidase-related amidase